ncbi:16S rRNA (guanine(527)-N(7))-methyltransferase RsmG [Porphyrobacter sp. CACIAM 03H1]|uniref:16S rRNA (guanine(527)-N(7))-methyltransferase RsmG n=1 Tax=Porphyrobacter sp. CACIAM 03H1 TaxID=2003315 RepID=UPI000B5AA243|nr:16S rRNA (guanine(527)-N(7))-methyltransferase RsmG [Porphyrobacter sp. CACIAM 03H1]ASJ89828.1 16S rRNA (guanine(527)-N(7))-methyltransferase RsmG [Porphyrobacter sp. CACIAM 03H1]
MITNEAEARAYVAGLTDAAGMARLEAFAALVLDENLRQNLIAKATEPQLWQRHIADSAQLLENVSRETLGANGGGPWLDLGSGPGFPGLVIAALCPNMPVVLVESRARRVQFLNRAIAALDLRKCRVEGQRLEHVAPFEARAISARAFAPLTRLLDLSAPFSTRRTVYVLPKGRSAAQELDTLKPSIRAMFHVKHSLTDPEAGIIVKA